MNDNETRHGRIRPYYFYVQTEFDKFWSKYGAEGRRVLFIFGLGFDPRCVPALELVGKTFSHNSEVETFLCRFTNHCDRYLTENKQYTEECLTNIRTITDNLAGEGINHHEIEVNMFSEDRRLVGDYLLVEEFRESSCGMQLDRYTDIIVDISAFPRTLMYALLGYLWKQRARGQNLFALLTEIPMQVHIEELDYTEPRFMLGGAEPKKGSHVTWIPVLGGRIDRFARIYDFLNPNDIFPIIPFPSRNPRLGDEILLEARTRLFDAWGVPFSSVMYASGEVLFDVFRKIQDIVADNSDFTPDISLVVSALSGRSISLGVLLAALWSNLPICHSQPTTYYIDRGVREHLKAACSQAKSMLYWLDGRIYEI